MKTLTRLFTLLLGFALALQLGVVSVAAQVTRPNNNPAVDAFRQQNEGSANGITNPVIGNLGDNVAQASSGQTFLSYFITVWTAVISIGALIVIIYFIWAAIDWIAAGGDSSKVAKARNKITQAVIGLVLLVSSFVIIGYISQLFFGNNFDILNPTLPTPNEANSNNNSGQQFNPADLVN